VSLSTGLGALAQLVLAVAVGWVVGARLLSFFSSSTSHGGTRSEVNIEWPERALIAIVGFLGFCATLMVVNIVTGGAIFGLRVPVPAAGLVVLIAGYRERAWPRAVPWLKVAGAAVVLLAIFVSPVLLGGSGVRDGDPPWHMGWTEELLAGEAVPAGPAPEGRNAYPWGMHALMATMVRLVPGSDPLVALEALNLLLLLAVPAAAACLARRLDVRAGWAGAACAALIGGFGWLFDAPGLVASPSEATGGADLVVASPNSVYELFPPALPRELGLVALVGAGLLLTMAARPGNRRAAIGAGVSVGVVGLASVPMFVAALLWATTATAVTERGRMRMLVSVLGPALLVFALWAGPVIADFVRYGGFVDITPKLGVEWPLGTALASWGLLLPLAAWGVVVVLRRLRRSSIETRVLVAFAGATAVLLTLSLMRGWFDWRLAGNATVLHQGRVWPLAHLLAAAFAGVGLVGGFELLRRRSQAVAAGFAAAVLAVGVASPVIAAWDLGELIRSHRKGYIYSRPALGPGSFVREAAMEMGPDDVVRVDGSTGLAFALFSFSGVRLARYDDDRLAGNDLRIRYADLARRWDLRTASGGYDPDYRVLYPRLAPPRSEPIVSGEFGHKQWWLIRD
jgi:hypothetical protein